VPAVPAVPAGQAITCAVQSAECRVQAGKERSSGFGGLDHVDSWASLGTARPCPQSAMHWPRRWLA
jgi:hypothetical protein